MSERPEPPSPWEPYWNLIGYEIERDNWGNVAIPIFLIAVMGYILPLAVLVGVAGDFFGWWDFKGLTGR